MKVYDYPKEFEELWKTIPGRGNGNNKETGYRLFTRMIEARLVKPFNKGEKVCIGCAKVIDKLNQKQPWFSEQLKEKNKYIEELLKERDNGIKQDTLEDL